MNCKQPSSFKWLTIQSLEQYRDNITIHKAEEPFFVLFFFKSGIATIKLRDQDVLPLPESLCWVQPQIMFKIDTAETISGYCLLLHQPLHEAIAYDPALIYHPNFRDLFLPKQVMQVSLSWQLRINSLFESIYE